MSSKNIDSTTLHQLVTECEESFLCVEASGRAVESNIAAPSVQQTKTKGGALLWRYLVLQQYHIQSLCYKTVLKIHYLVCITILGSQFLVRCTLLLFLLYIYIADFNLLLIYVANKVYNCLPLRNYN